MLAVLVGDSIRLGYEPVVVDLLGVDATVSATLENCGSTDDILANYDAWVTARLAPGAVVHLNAGLHDVRRIGGAWTEPQVSVDAYRGNLERLVGRLITSPGCDRVILATTTYVHDVRHAHGARPNRFLADVVAYNEVLVDVAGHHAIEVDDLFAVTAADPAQFLSADGVHLSEAGNAAVAGAVVRALTGVETSAE